jgi:DNA-binding NarL/FixJ family response regulator
MHDIVTRDADCRHCDSGGRTVRHGYTGKGRQRYRCRACGRSFVRNSGSEVARVVIADDNDLVRKSVKAMLTGERDLRIVGEAADGREALGLCYRVRPDVVLADVRMPEMDGLAATLAIKQQFPHICVLILTMHESQGYLLEALRAGASGYVLKGATRRELVTAIREALDGEIALNRKLATRMLLRLADGEREPSEPLPEPGRSELPQPLTPRELDVLKLLALGRTNREIALGLAISASTAKRHVENIVAKMEVSDRTQAVVRALEQGIISYPSVTRRR